MNISFFVSLIVGLGSLIMGFLMEGGAIGKLVAPTAIIIVFGGLLGATTLSFPPSELKKVPKLFKILLIKRKLDKEQLIEDIKNLSIKVRKEGLLSLESELSSGNYDSFLVHGLRLITDGVESETVRSSLEIRLDNMEYRHSKGIGIFEAAGGYAPTMGVIGTVMGLIQVLSDLSNPDTLGPKIATAFIATFYGVGIANVVFLPIASRLKALDEDEVLAKSMIIEGVILIYSGSNVSLVEERLRGFLENAKEEREEGE